MLICSNYARRIEVSYIPQRASRGYQRASQKLSLRGYVVELFAHLNLIEFRRPAPKGGNVSCQPEPRWRRRRGKWWCRR